MSKQEILSWTSLGTALSVLFFYVLFVFGWPGFLPDYSDQLYNLFFKIFWIAVAIELVLDFIDKKNKVDKDERDFMIEAYGVKYAYNFLMVAIVFILVQIPLSEVFGQVSELHELLGSKRVIFHALFIIILTATLIKRGTMIYYYRKDFV